MAAQKGQAINARYLTVGKSLPDDLDGDAVLLAPIHRRQYRSVDDEKVRIRCRNPMALFIVVCLGPGKGKQPIRPAFGGSEGPELLGHCFKGTVVLVGWVVTCRVDDRVIGAEPCQGVHMRIGIIPGQVTVFDPKIRLAPSA